MRILHLYPDLMNLYGDYGNVKVLASHLKDLGIDVSIDTLDLNGATDLNDYDFIYMGSGTESKQQVALDDLLRFRKELKEYIENDKVALFTGNAMELFGKKVGEKDGLGFLDFRSEISEKRYTGDVIMENEETGKVVGFINKSSLISGGEKNKLFTYEFKDNNLKDNDYEGYRFHNLFGTHIIGPVLVKNPGFMKLLLKLLAKDKYQDINYPYETEAYNITLNELEKRK